ncbi:hypothetical protein LTR78_009095 [Recurvomyces mirabilis]|uniref:NADP-dependent oxidoreductase domain-containing protein n=1 Tax=Recurvomyces mirabilis TaxID=574656 RepID=A0AAE0TPA9_9PEZI|nr:hypothetical protein LTR78_009095 [Recurvomyces mirabilis]KAK5161033.1 hypothetical protein LTS14_000827 [Recurvomyces mirabilis]
MPPTTIFGDIGKLHANDLRTTLQSLDIHRIDTAARYQDGESEKIIGAASFPKDFTIDTKIKFWFPGDGTLTSSAIETSLTNSLKVLGPDYATPLSETAEAFDDQYRRGRFTHLGVSNFMPEMLQEYIDICDKEGYVKPTVYEGHYNLLCRSYEETLFPLLREYGIAFNAYSPLGGGFLLGNFTTEGHQSGSRFATQGGMYNNFYDRPALHEAVAKLRAISEKSGLGMDELNLRWLKFHSILGDEDGMILGASKLPYIEKNHAQLSKGPLQESVAKQLDALFTDDVKRAATEIVDFKKMVGR